MSEPEHSPRPRWGGMMRVPRGEDEKIGAGQLHSVLQAGEEVADGAFVLVRALKELMSSQRAGQHQGSLEKEDTASPQSKEVTHRLDCAMALLA